MNEKQMYPAWRYQWADNAVGHIKVVVQSEAEAAALGEGWYLNPGHVIPPAAPEPEAPVVPKPTRKGRR